MSVIQFEFAGSALLATNRLPQDLNDSYFIAT